MQVLRIIGNDGTQLSLEADEPYRWLATLNLEGATGAAHVENGPHYRTGATIADLFAQMADCWRGWTGVKEWENNEGTLTLCATHNGLGHISIEVVLRNYAHREWELVGTLTVDAGALEHLARAAAEFDRAQAATDGRYPPPSSEIGPELAD
jgi:hypothetical protein